MKTSRGSALMLLIWKKMTHFRSPTSCTVSISAFLCWKMSIVLKTERWLSISSSSTQQWGTRVSCGLEFHYFFFLSSAINGYVYGNLPPLDVCVGNTVSWHLFGIGNEVDVHSAYFHGHTLLDRGHRTDVLSLFPATFVTAKMIPMTTGKWMLSCQVNDHMQGILFPPFACSIKANKIKRHPLMIFFIYASCTPYIAYTLSIYHTNPSTFICMLIMLI